MSFLFVANNVIILISLSSLDLTPSISESSAFRVLSRSELELSPLFPPTASTSSIKTIAVFEGCSFASSRAAA